MAFQRARLEEKAFLLGVTMLMPWVRKAGYASATSWLLVLSTRTRLSGSSARNLRVWVVVRGGEVDASRSCSQVERESGVVRWVARRLLLEREMRTREMLGNFWPRAESWERKWRPTPPAPGDFVRSSRWKCFSLVLEIFWTSKWRAGVVRYSSAYAARRPHFMYRSRRCIQLDDSKHHNCANNSLYSIFRQEAQQRQSRETPRKQGD